MFWLRRKSNMIKHDEIRLRHMIEAAREAVSFARGRVRSDLYPSQRTNAKRPTPTNESATKR